jgi:hypothetical protein
LSIRTASRIVLLALAVRIAMIRFDLGAWRSGGQCYALLFVIGVDDPYRDHIADLDELVGVFDERGPELADVDESCAVWSKFDKDAKVSDADDQG